MRFQENLVSSGDVIMKRAAVNIKSVTCSRASKLVSQSMMRVSGLWNLKKTEDINIAEILMLASITSLLTNNL